MPKIVCLIRKDFILVKQYLWFLAIYAVLFSTFIQTTNPILLYTMLPGMLLIIAIGLEMRQSNQQFIVSLPVSRNYLVLAKYASSLVFIILALVVCILVNSAATFIDFGKIQVDLQIVLGTLPTMIVFLAVYLPLFYWLSPKWAQLLNIAMMIVVMVGNTAVTEMLSSSFIADKIAGRPALTGILVTSFTILSLIVSYIISVAIFRKRDL